MPKEKSLGALEALYHQVKLKYEEINQTAIRDRRSDYELLSQGELSGILNGNISNWRKMRVLHTQIGYLRINAFHEYYEQIDSLRQKNELFKAAELMNEYAVTLSIPFVLTKKQPTVLKRLRRMFHLKDLTDPIATVHNWRSCYASWLEVHDGSRSRRIEEDRQDFQSLLTAFLTLYTYSFSVSNFPPLGQRRTDR